ncbi:hypothetical protein [Candidatus Mycoplasma haematohominis]|uniref:Uncharacterized protein n=1 Tax=Candidatus Mycoplasma haematohominis TaxID=1494318 RepID=A0A478FRL9_9MOLU|nr:hypothetical protein [Candidatus Mycoplasma haemohominis]GCE63704.1 hypothetical protein MHSWG343_07040 [Candidatus Mycoplasma haemohominis]
MSTQAVAGAAAGVAVLGGGGTLSAYAAGAFDPKVKEKKQETNTYKSLVESDTSKEYIGDNEDEIKTLWDNAGSNYKTNLKVTHWDNMQKEDILISDKPEKTDKSQFDVSNKKDVIAKYVSAWCQAVSKKELQAVPASGSSKRFQQAVQKVMANERHLNLLVSNKKPEGNLCQLKQ